MRYGAVGEEFSDFVDYTGGAGAVAKEPPLMAGFGKNLFN
jgi:hypothetical protein